MVVRESGEQTQIAVLEDDVLVENFVTSSGSGSLVGNVYLGRVQNVLPSMEAAFVDIGRGRNAVLYAGEVDWDAAGLAGKARRIEQALSTGDSVLVQVTKDPVGHKGARLTTQISLPGRFLVYVPGGGATGISRKLPDNERKRLKEILRRIVPENAGVIIRTASEGTSEDALDRDVRRLQAQWEIIKEKSEVPKAQAPQLLYEEPDLLIKVVRDLFTEDFSGLTVQGDGAWDTIEAYVQHVAPDLMSRLHKHTSKTDVFTEQRINEQIAKALDRKVWLPSGGYLVIDRTEAMTVIDVNTGKFTGSGGNLEETVTRNNLEAAEEIVRQLRLRDIGGIIVIDFIDMVLESNRDLVLRRLTECLGRDRTRHQVAEVTSLGLVQMTRKRVGTGLLEAYSSTCEHCRGRGLMVSNEPVVHSHDHGNGGGSKRGRRGKQNGQDDSGQKDGGQKDSGQKDGSHKDGGEKADKSEKPEKGAKEDKPKEAKDSKDKGSGDRKGSKEDAKREHKPESQGGPEPTRGGGDKSDVKAESKGGEPTGVEDQPAKGSADQDRASQNGAAKEAPWAAEPTPAASASGEPAAEHKAAEQKAAEQAPAQAADTASAPAVSQQKPQQPAGESGTGASADRPKRRKAGRQVVSTGSSAAVVVAEPGKEAQSAPVPEPERIEAPLPRKPRRRAVSRPDTSAQQAEEASGD
jgi:ribonuclease E